MYIGNLLSSRLFLLQSEVDFYVYIITSRDKDACNK